MTVKQTASRFVVFPASVEETVGRRRHKTRVYERRAAESEFADWYDTLVKNVGPVMTPGEVSLYVDVSRVAIHKRLDSGKLTGFVLELEADSAQAAGEKRRLREKSVTYIPYCEVAVWAAERRQRLKEDLEEEKRTLEETVESLQREVEELRAWRKDREQEDGMSGEDFFEDDLQEQAAAYFAGEEADRPLAMTIEAERQAAASGNGPAKKSVGRGGSVRRQNRREGSANHGS